MSVFGFFQPSVMGMDSQSHALSVISGNIANVTTGGYKRTDVEFQTVLSREFASRPGDPDGEIARNAQSDIGGVRAKDYARIGLQGEIVSSDRDLDIAISGRGFFVLNTELDGSGETLFGRDGHLSVATGPKTSVTAADGSTITVNEGYLVDKNGFYLQGWKVNPDGAVSTGSGSLSPIRIDAYSFSSAGAPTTRAALSLNLPADDTPGDLETYAIDVYDSLGHQRSLGLNFTKTAPNAWGLDIAAGTGEVVTLTPSAPTLTFEPGGGLVSPAEYTVSVSHVDGATSNFTLNLNELSQFAGALMPFAYTQDGFAAGQLRSIEFDEQGFVIGLFDNGRTQPLYKLPLADFVNPNGLATRDGNVYAESGDSGSAAIGLAGEKGLGLLSPDSLEMSNVELSEEFSKMMLTQNAYNSSATAFRTADEMTQVARDLKR